MGSVHRRVAVTPPDAVTWFLPGVALSVFISLVLAGEVARSLGCQRVTAFLLLVSLGVILSATLTPIRSTGDVVSPACDLTRLALAPVERLQTMNDTSLNVVLFIPLGLAIGLLDRSGRKAALVIAAFAFPILIEGLQLAIPALGRGCESADVIDNLAGLSLGLLAGSFIGTVASGRLAPPTR